MNLYEGCAFLLRHSIRCMALRVNCVVPPAGCERQPVDMRSRLRPNGCVTSARRCVPSGLTRSTRRPGFNQTTDRKSWLILVEVMAVSRAMQRTAALAVDGYHEASEYK